MKLINKIFCGFTILILFGCSKSEVDLVFDQLPEERMGERLEELQNKLLESPYGWHVSLPTSAGGAFGFYMDFHEDQTVDMVGDITDETASLLATSTYRVTWVMNASLIFDTYNYITLLQDPGAVVDGASSGSGLQSDIEFEYVRSTTDSLILKGKKYQNAMILTKVTAEEKEKYTTGGFKDIIDDYVDFFANHLNNYINFTKDGVSTKMALKYNHGAKTLTYEVIEVDESVSSSSGKFFYSLNGIGLATDLSYGDLQLSSGKIKADGKFYIYDTKGTEYEVFQNEVPLTPLKSLFNYNGTYKSIYISGNALPSGVSSSFNDVFNAMVSRFAATNRTITSVEFAFQNSTTVKINIRYLSGTTAYLADASFSYVYSDGILTLSNYTPSVSNTNWTTRATQIGAFADWLKTGPFKVDWVSSTNASVTGLGGLYRVEDEGAFFYGVLQ
ncbi:DUF4302 domain-containing protein [Sphingobacterium sp. LRF_L2]|uniref:DUF4302 domain-containing protein n=1 Tax=Sphingobacterium sp. LRF_L2 TaxID=3369421 RepID=UPI003F608A30